MTRRWRYYFTAAGGQVVRKELQDLGPAAAGAVTEAMKRAKQGALLPREDEGIRGDLRAIRVSFDGNTYRALYASEGAHGEILLALHVLHKKSRSCR